MLQQPFDYNIYTVFNQKIIEFYYYRTENTWYGLSGSGNRFSAAHLSSSATPSSDFSLFDSTHLSCTIPIVWECSWLLWWPASAEDVPNKNVVLLWHVSVQCRICCICGCSHSCHVASCFTSTEQVSVAGISWHKVCLRSVEYKLGAWSSGAYCHPQYNALKT